MDRADDPKRYNAAQDIFWEAAELQEPERSAFVQRRCGDDNDLLERVDDLLKYHDSSSLEGLESLHANAVEAMLDKETRFGPFRLQGVIGRGGMGIVYRALDASDNLVAVKVIPPTGRSSGSRARFRREIHTLKRLEHPGICRLLTQAQYQFKAINLLSYFCIQVAL